MKQKMIKKRQYLGGMLNNLKTWVVTYKGEVVEKFRIQGAAKNFIMQNNKDYFYELKLECVVT